MEIIFRLSQEYTVYSKQVFDEMNSVGFTKQKMKQLISAGNICNLRIIIFDISNFTFEGW